MEAEATLKVSRYIVQGMALILCTAAVEMEAEVTQNISINRPRDGANVVCLCSQYYDFTGADSCKIFPVR